MSHRRLLCYNPKMEMWFVYALLSALGAGTASVLKKIGVENGFDILKFNTINVLVSGSVALIVFLLTFGINFNWLLIVLTALASGLLHFIGTIIDESLYYTLIDVSDENYFTWISFFGVIVMSFSIYFFWFKIFNNKQYLKYK
jgi:uncharacterized membrane protein